MNETKYSIIIPVYNSEKTLIELTNRLTTVLSKITINYEIIFIDDCSSDNSWQILKELYLKDHKVKIIRLQKNFGQHNATLCGLNHAKGDYVITMDDDLQHPPEEIPKLINKVQDGFSVVFGKYKIKYHSRIKNFFSKQFQIFVRYILNLPATVFISSFVILRSDVVKNMIHIKSSYIYLPALIQKSVPINKIINVEVSHNPRNIGKSKYNLTKYFSFALNLIINYSSLPLIALSVFGFLLSLTSFGFGFLILINKILDPNYGVLGWNSLMVAISFIGGTILIGMGIIGEYLRRILTEVSHGQQYVIGEMESWEP
ncbi:MAG: glycosyltransferase family 2 protein [Thermoplasmata archaeon]|nr:glycosyltransferase family 2 protein [Thermoplasmata archaeon]